MKIDKVLSYIPTWTWILLALIALTTSVTIEFEFMLIPCNSAIIAKGTNNIALALSYSYIAAVVFHLMVNELPQYRRKMILKPLLDTNVLKICEEIRLCIECVIPLKHICDRKYSKTEFVQRFEEENFHEAYFWGNGISKKEYLEERRKKITQSAYLVLSYREYISEKLFLFLNDVLNSTFIMQGIRDYPNVNLLDRIGYDDNQREIGECIYNLYENSKLVIQNIQGNHEKE